MSWFFQNHPESKMDEPSARQDIDDQLLIPTSNLLASAATGLFLIFFVTIISEIFPIKLLDPRWQVSLIGLLLRGGLYALVGFAMLHIAAAFNPGNLFVRLRLGKLRQLALIASMGFLLLIPLQGFATWRSYKLAKADQLQTIQIAQKKLSPIKQAVKNATSIEDLQLKLKSIRGQAFELDAEEAARPINEVKKGLLARIENLEIQFQDKFSTVKPNEIWSAIQSSFFHVFTSIGYAMAFAAGAQAKGSSETLLESFSHRFGSLTGRSRRRRKRSRVSDEFEDYQSNDPGSDV